MLNEETVLNPIKRLGHIPGTFLLLIDRRPSLFRYFKNLSMEWNQVIIELNLGHTKSSLVNKAKS
jgi:hypothetical protein